MAWMWAVQGPSVSTLPNIGRTIATPLSRRLFSITVTMALRGQASAGLGARRPALREGAQVLLRIGIPRLGCDLPSHADALLDDFAVAKLGEALGRDQHAGERPSAARPEQRREIRLPGLRHRRRPEAGLRSQGAIGVAGGDDTFPVPALQSGRVGLAPQRLGRGEVAARDGLLDLEEPSLPARLGVGSDGVVGDYVPYRCRQQHRAESRGDRWDEQAEPAARPELPHDFLHAHSITQGRYHPGTTNKTNRYESWTTDRLGAAGQELNTVLTGE